MPLGSTKESKQTVYLAYVLKIIALQVNMDISIVHSKTEHVVSYVANRQRWAVYSVGTSTSKSSVKVCDGYMKDKEADDL